MSLAALALLVQTATVTAPPPPVRRTITSTTFSITTTVRSPEVEAPKIEKPAPTPPKPLGPLLAGMHTESGLFRSPFLSDRMSAVSPQQPMQGELSELVLLFGIGLTGEVRFSWFAIVPAVTYLFTPRFFSVDVSTDGSVEAHLSFAQAITGAVRGHFYLPLSGWIDLVFAGGPSIVHARFRGRGETALGGEARFGFQFHNRDLPDARLLGSIRYAPIDFGDGVELDLSGVGLVADLVFGLL